jgi:RimJ/RimL family protein N-acetyltransferase
MSSNVEVHEHIAGTGAEKLAIRGMYEAMNSGHIFSIHVTPEVEVITASQDGEPVAFIAFEEYIDITEFWLVFGYCVPEWRRRGPYQDCLKALREIANERGYTIIYTAAHPDNVAARASIEARGGALKYLTFTFPVES